MPELAHVVLYVRDLERSRAFYTRVVGLTQVGTTFHGRAAVLTGVLRGDLPAGTRWGSVPAELGPLVAALASVLATVIVTGALHEDGLADVADGPWGGACPGRPPGSMRRHPARAQRVLSRTAPSPPFASVMRWATDFGSRLPSRTVAASPTWQSNS